MAPKKKKKGEEIDMDNLPPWTSLNIAFNYSTCIKSIKNIKEQISTFQKDGYFTTVTRKDIQDFVPKEGEGKKKGLDDQSKDLTDEQLALKTKLFLEAKNLEFRIELQEKLDEEEEERQRIEEEKKKLEEKAKKDAGKKKKVVDEEKKAPAPVVEEKKEEAADEDETEVKIRKCDMYFCFMDYPQTQNEYLTLS